MHLEAIRAITDWLAGTTLDYQGANQGVNAQLATVPLDVGDVAPDSVVFFGDATRDDIVAQQGLPVNAPAIYVSAASPAISDGEVIPGPPGVRDARNLGVAIRYIRRDANTAAAFRDTGYTLRAVIKSLKQFCRSENAAARLRNSIQMRDQLSLTWGIAAEWEGAAGVTGAVIVTWYVRDLAP
jgi:hypothetical protein